jgi:hypothetical protein
MRILKVESYPLHLIPFERAGRKGTIEIAVLPLLEATVDHLPAGIDGIVATSDLQGCEASWKVPAGAPSDPPREARLLGEAVAEALVALSERGTLPPAERLGIFLAGDFYTLPRLERRGGAGDVREVWLSFADRFRWVAGAAGNHDLFGANPHDRERFRAHPGVHLLDGHVVLLDGMRVGGVSGVIGDPMRPNRRVEADHVAAIRKVVGLAPEVLLLHDGPDVPGTSLRGSPVMREAVADSPGLLVVRGHKFWETPLLEVADRVQVLNVEGRAVLLRRSVDEVPHDRAEA